MGSDYETRLLSSIKMKMSSDYPFSYSIAY